MIDQNLTLLVEVKFSEVGEVESGVVFAPLLRIEVEEVFFQFVLQVDLVFLPIPLHLPLKLPQLLFLLPLQACKLVGDIFHQGRALVRSPGYDTARHELAADGERFRWCW
jgi:hypothetical protein